MARTKIIAGNWKMNKTVAEATSLVEELKKELATFEAAAVVLCPPFTALVSVARLLQSAPRIQLGAQNLHPAPSGAFTGEISAAMLREAGCRFVIVGHSERRRYFGETDAFLREKLLAAVAAGLRPIFCVGEELPDRESGRWPAHLRSQLQGALSGLSVDALSQIVLAYEPVWAIGTGRNATPEQAEEAHALLRKELEALHGATVASKMPIQYGGSVTPRNAGELLAQPDVDGLLVGGASLDAGSFTSIVFAVQ
ncbi:triosephosphate isomerase (TIM) [Methylacidimicrobium cyclopophantes]|uniref:Triosephosphate isomerase n=1 Tax=Methylacidimicrobium cyclopophantes TaxID=1041766 RepID=A0A5E6MRH4_9BACT|nr:triose-phosphate isomerase [Methylacidimicrobium cyclopophantes]VVM08520.1 triosephosphate isomerase (TIM) [Methylacidimicrobium cyclopophantes]